jgi:hypothetical protein
VTRQADTWWLLKVHGPCDIARMVELSGGLSTKTVASCIRELRDKGYARSTGQRMHMFYEAVGDDPPPNNRNRGRFRTRVCAEQAFVVKSRREGTPGEIPPIPSLAELLAR